MEMPAPPSPSRIKVIQGDGSGRRRPGGGMLRGGLGGYDVDAPVSG